MSNTLFTDLDVRRALKQRAIADNGYDTIAAECRYAPAIVKLMADGELRLTGRVWRLLGYRRVCRFEVVPGERRK